MKVLHRATDQRPRIHPASKTTSEKFFDKRRDTNCIQAREQVGRARYVVLHIKLSRGSSHCLVSRESEADSRLSFARDPSFSHFVSSRGVATIIIHHGVIDENEFKGDDCFSTGQGFVGRWLLSIGIASCRSGHGCRQAILLLRDVGANSLRQHFLLSHHCAKSSISFPMDISSKYNERFF